MGEISDYYRRNETEDNDWIIDNRPVWITGKGKAIRLENMTTKHIINTIRAWEGLGKTTPPEGWCGGKMKWLDLLTNELLRRLKL